MKKKKDLTLSSSAQKQKNPSVKPSIIPSVKLSVKRQKKVVVNKNKMSVQTSNNVNNPTLKTSNNSFPKKDYVVANLTDYRAVQDIIDRTIYKKPFVEKRDKVSVFFYLLLNYQSMIYRV